jgi:hypothetical protein
MTVREMIRKAKIARSHYLSHLFQEKTVLFIGYGLEDLEILEYLIQKGRMSNWIYRRCIGCGRGWSRSAPAAVVSRLGGPIPSIEGVKVMSLSENGRPVDTLVVVGGSSVFDLTEPEFEHVLSLRNQPLRTRRCTRATASRDDRIAPPAKP